LEPKKIDQRLPAGSERVAKCSIIVNLIHSVGIWWLSLTLQCGEEEQRILQHGRRSMSQAAQLPRKEKKGPQRQQWPHRKEAHLTGEDENRVIEKKRT